MRGRRPEVTAIATNVTALPSALPPPPDTLPAGMGDLWSTIAADLQSRGLLHHSTLSVLETYVGAVWLAREARKSIARDGPVVQAKDGQPKPHPAGAMLKSANETVARLGAELGITPAARLRKGMGGGDNPRDDDDAAALGV